MEERKELKLTFDVPPSVNNYLKPRGNIIYVHNKPIVTLSMFETAEAKAYKKRFKKYALEQMKKQGWEISLDKNAYYVIESVVYFKALGADSNNLWKISLDALTDVQVWRDDSMVIERCKRVYCDAENPRIEFTIYIAEHTGVFDNEGDYKEFSDKCATCTRFLKGRCSLLVKALESRIQEELCKDEDDKWICNTYKEKVIKVPKVKKPPKSKKKE